MKNTFPTWAVAVAACMPALAIAQMAKAGAQASAPQLSYQSAFANYKPYKDIPLANWRAVNDAVASGAQGMGQTSKPMADPPRQPMPTPEGHPHDKRHGGTQ
jgi:hypothetical protein